MSALPTAGNDGGASHGDSWQTPRTARGGYTRDKGETGKERLTIEGEAAKWASPVAEDAECAGRREGSTYQALNVQVRQKQSWCTPSAENFRTRGGDRANEMGLDNQAKTWTTPTDDDANNVTRESGQFKSLTRDVQNWGTPRADEYKGTGPKGSASQVYRLEKNYLDAQVEEVEDKAKLKQQLNPDWEEVLMGWPIGWTEPLNFAPQPFPGWPMGQGQKQFDYEPARTIPKGTCPNRTSRVKACGNGVVPQTAEKAFSLLLK